MKGHPMARVCRRLPYPVGGRANGHVVEWRGLESGIERGSRILRAFYCGFGLQNR
jgi:hypothetical protein